MSSPRRNRSRQNRLSNFNPVTNPLVGAKDGGIFDRALINPDKNNFAPRLGLAYNLTRKTVIRSGGGISYVHFNRLGGENLASATTCRGSSARASTRRPHRDPALPDRRPIPAPARRRTATRRV